MNPLQTEHWLAATARWWLQSTRFGAGLPSLDASGPESRSGEQGPVHVNVAAANRRDIHDRCVRPDVPLVQ